MSRLRSKTVVCPTPLNAANAFYEAFEARDLEAMMAVWAEDEDIICVHPSGARLVGYAAVRASWSEIFSSGVGRRIRLAGAVVMQTISMAVQCVTEHVTVGDEEEPRPPLEVTNIFLHTPAGWRMLAHHASPAPVLKAAAQLPPAKLH